MFLLNNTVFNFKALIVSIVFKIVTYSKITIVF